MNDTPKPEKRCPKCGGLHRTGPGLGDCNGPPVPSGRHPLAGKMMG